MNKIVSVKELNTLNYRGRLKIYNLDPKDAHIKSLRNYQNAIFKFSGNYLVCLEPNGVMYNEAPFVVDDTISLIYPSLVELIDPIKRDIKGILLFNYYQRVVIQDKAFLVLTKDDSERIRSEDHLDKYLELYGISKEIKNISYPQFSNIFHGNKEINGEEVHIRWIPQN